MKKRIESILRICRESLATYGKHPIIDSQIQDLLNDLNSKKPACTICGHETLGWENSKVTVGHGDVASNSYLVCRNPACRAKFTFSGEYEDRYDSEKYMNRVRA